MLPRRPDSLVCSSVHVSRTASRISQRFAFDAFTGRFAEFHAMTTAGNSVKNVLNSDVEIKGNIRFAGELTFEGKLDGEISSDGTLHLGDSAVVTGNINVGNVTVRGKVNGNVTAKDKIEIKAKTELFGDIRASKLAVEEGVTFVGKTEVNPNKVAPSAAPPKPPEKGPEVPKPIIR